MVMSARGFGFPAVSLIAVAMVVSCGGGADDDCPSGFSPNTVGVCIVPRCDNDVQCDDGEPCTDNVCNMLSHECETTPIDCQGDSQCAADCGLLVPGDCTQDGRLSIGDATCVAACVSGSQTTFECGRWADCNCDLRLSDDDIACVVKTIQGLPVITRCAAPPADCNGNGRVESADALCIQACLDGTAPAEVDCVRAADCNCDGEVDDEDVRCAATRAVELVPEREFCEILDNR